MRTWILRSLALLSLLCVLPTHSQENAAVALFVIEADPIFDREGHGLLATLHGQVMRYAGLRTDVRIFPARRAQRYFLQNPASMLFPAVRGACYASAHLESRPLMITRRLLVTRRGEDIGLKPSALSGKRLGVIQGYQYHLAPELLQSVTLVKARNLFSLYRMLEKHRIDAFIADPLFLELLATRLELDLERLNFNTAQPVDEAALVYSVHNTASGRQLLARVDLAINQLHLELETKVLPERLRRLIPPDDAIVPDRSTTGCGVAS